MILIKILLVLVLVFIVHSIIPTYYNKIFNKNAIRKTDTDNNIMLTFDDGPDKRYINQLLAVLEKNDVKAIFFMVAKNAQNNSEIVKKIENKGHKIALHSWEHKNAMLYSYFYTKKDFENSKQIMSSLGVKDFIYRPPWGHTNIFSNHFVKKHNMKLMYWDVMAEDWSASSTPESISEKLLKRTTKNSIICLHDAGENSGGAKDAPLNTIEGLDIAIPKLKEKGYNFVLPQ
ncbi:polysaccharide deacetylase family protein [Peptostreptococcus faecalis]|uniref:polysaccharide deacetylase family protein n=1 Tax=Peptostreptococcus faecalis TaxID=2045015 RepID=UPI000C79C37B|nr:polysaccharide deacetylase family protein [Peptostreptococcus faecalis]